MHVTEQELTSEEIIERLQEKVTLVDKLREAEILERKLREVRDLEERLQEIGEMSERLQGVIEDELGKEEVDKLIEELQDLEQEEQIQVEGTKQTVVKKSVRRIEAKEDEVDELEEQIKRVFLKDLLPEEEEAGVSEKEVTNESLSDDSLREALRQKLRSGVMSEERLEKEGRWRVTEILEENTERKVTERLQAEEPSQVADEDVWFILFDRLPYKAVFKPPGTVYQCANSYRPLLISLILSNILLMSLLLFFVYCLTIEQQRYHENPL